MVESEIYIHRFAGYPKGESSRLLGMGCTYKEAADSGRDRRDRPGGPGDAPKVRTTFNQGLVLEIGEPAAAAGDPAFALDARLRRLGVDAKWMHSWSVWRTPAQCASLQNIEGRNARPDTVVEVTRPQAPFEVPS